MSDPRLHLGHFACAEEALTWMHSSGLSIFERSVGGSNLERANAFHIIHRTSPELAEARRERIARINATGLHEPPLGDLTAQPTAEYVSATREEPNSSDLLKHGAVTRHRDRVALADPLSARALAFAFGAEGAKWAAHEKGRLVALFPLVPAGIALVERAKAAELCMRCKHARKRHTLDYNAESCEPPKGVCSCRGFAPSLQLSDADRLKVAMVVDDMPSGRDAEAHALIVRATREAGELLADALKTWEAMA